MQELQKSENNIPPMFMKCFNQEQHLGEMMEKKADGAASGMECEAERRG